MLLGDLLIAHGLVTQADVMAALEQQRLHGKRLGEILVDMGRLSEAELIAALQAVPSPPLSLEETGLQLPELLNLLTKALHTGSTDTPSKVSEVLKLPLRLVQQLAVKARERQLIEVLGLPDGGATSQMRFALTERGREWAQQAFEQNAYVGPAPVTLSDYVERIQRQAIGNERVPPASVERALTNLVMSDDLVSQLGPAINSGRSVLLYGPPGNGKTSVAERIGNIFNTMVYIPHCFEVDGQIIKVFDPAIHKEITAPGDEPLHALSIRTEDSDRRWVPCRRPFIVTGGELTLEMLDLSFNPLAKFYEAPLHVKALNGTFLIDDFGRQLVPPEVLLNRWIVPLESRVDYLKLHTGKSFSLPFDELVIFSTNLSPSQLMDPAFLRRIPYKIEVPAPSKEEYRDIFNLVSRARGVEPSDEVIDFVISELTERNDFPLGGYQPGFIVSQILAASKYRDIPAAFHRDMLTFAISNLYTKDSAGFGMAARKN
jgi:hypothetical protein